MKQLVTLLLASVVLSFISGCIRSEIEQEEMKTTIDTSNHLELPDPSTSGDVSIEEALLRRRSVRQYSNDPLTQAEISQLLWAAQGITDSASGKRTAPSAGALYPLEIYLAASNIQGFQAGVYHYLPHENALEAVSMGDPLDALSKAALNQECVRDGAAALVFAAIYERTTGKYKDRGIRYVHIEVGHAAQNVLLQAGAMELGSVVIGAFDDSAVHRVIGMQENERALYIIPLGHR